MQAVHVILTFLANIAETVIAVIFLAGMAAKIKPIGQGLKQALFNELYLADKCHDERLDRLELQQLKQIICDRRMPYPDRLNAGETYIRRGGNGEVRAIYDSLARYAAQRQLDELESRDRDGRAARRDT
jgi:hypothetical protein